jgi:flagellar biosynthesis protein FlhF
MNLQTFKAASMAEALAQVKSNMGHDAVILHTRTYQRRIWLGLRKQEVVEITAGRGLNVNSQRRVVRRGSGNDGPGLLPAAAPAPAVLRPRQLLETPAANSVVMLNVSQELTALKSMVKDLVNQQHRKQSPDVPEELFQHYLNLINNQVAEELAQQIVQNLRQEIRPEYLSQPQFVREKVAEQLEKLLPVAGPLVRTKRMGPHVVALIGPTGVGKTTTIAKLAANLKLREKHSVGLITLDTYRIAAIEQLRKYADILHCPLKAVGRPEDLPEAMQGMGNCEFVLIDTAGRSPNDTLKLGELKEFIDTAKPDEVHLVLSTTASRECVELAISRFGDVRVDKIIFTKIDEAAHVGVVLNVVHKVNKALSYITTGQDVPDDIEVGHGRKLAQLILGSSL